LMSTIASGKVRAGMGALPHESGVAFRVWASHADAVKDATHNVAVKTKDVVHHVSEKIEDASR
jgi:hypothetical protein